MERHSKQEEIILQEVKARCDHPTAAMVFEGLKNRESIIGIATVYRNLQKLVDNGKIIKIKAQDGIDRYDGNTSPHVHLECKKCGKIYDIFLNENEKIKIEKDLKEMSLRVGAKVESANIKIYGICKECIEK